MSLVNKCAKCGGPLGLYNWTDPSGTYCVKCKASVPGFPTSAAREDPLTPIAPVHPPMGAAGGTPDLHEVMAALLKCQKESEDGLDNPAACDGCAVRAAGYYPDCPMRFIDEHTPDPSEPHSSPIAGAALPVPTETQERRRASMLSPAEMWRLDNACKPLDEAFETPPYLVGSAMTDRDYRDVDVRMMLDGDQYDALIASPAILALLNMVFSDYLTHATGLPIDFGFQPQDEANEHHKGPRNPLGTRSLTNFRGDAPRRPAHTAPPEPHSSPAWSACNLDCGSYACIQNGPDACERRAGIPESVSLSAVMAALLKCQAECEAELDNPSACDSCPVRAAGYYPDCPMRFIDDRESDLPPTATARTECPHSVASASNPPHAGDTRAVAAPSDPNRGVL